MPQYTCPRCNYSTRRLHSFRAHLSREESCTVTHQNIPIEQLRVQYDLPTENVTHECNYCGKVYVSLSGVTYHMKKCEAAPSMKDIILQRVIAEKDQIISQQNELIKRYQDAAAAASASTNVTNNTVNNNNSVSIDNSQHVHIHINDFGKENKDYITTEFAVQCFEKGAHGIISMLDEIYFNKEHAENHNIRLRSLKNMLVDVLDDQKWVPKGLNDTVKRMISDSSDEIVKEAFPIVKDTLPIDEVAATASEIQNVTFQMSQSIKERTKAKLVERRDNIDSDLVPAN